MPFLEWTHPNNTNFRLSTSTTPPFSSPKSTDATPVILRLDTNTRLAIDIGARGKSVTMKHCQKNRPAYSTKAAMKSAVNTLNAISINIVMRMRCWWVLTNLFERNELGHCLTERERESENACAVTNTSHSELDFTSNSWTNKSQTNLFLYLLFNKSSLLFSVTSEVDKRSQIFFPGTCYRAF